MTLSPSSSRERRGLWAVRRPSTWSLSVTRSGRGPGSVRPKCVLKGVSLRSATGTCRRPAVGGVPVKVPSLTKPNPKPSLLFVRPKISKWVQPTTKGKVVDELARKVSLRSPETPSGPVTGVSSSLQINPLPHPGPTFHTAEASGHGDGMVTAEVSPRIRGSRPGNLLKGGERRPTSRASRVSPVPPKTDPGGTGRGRVFGRGPWEWRVREGPSLSFVPIFEQVQEKESHSRLAV